MRIRFVYVAITLGIIVLVVFRNMSKSGQERVLPRELWGQAVIQRSMDTLGPGADPQAPQPLVNPDPGIYIDDRRGPKDPDSEAKVDLQGPPAQQDPVLKAEAGPDTDRCAFCQVFDLRATPNMSLDIKCVPLRSTPETRICLYPSDKDIYISKSIAYFGMWEANEVLNFQSFLTRNPGMGVIDIGANIGVYTLSAAKMGRKVVAVEPNDEHVLRLHRAIHIEHLEPQVTLLNNAVGDIRGTVKVKKHFNNQGASEVEQVNAEVRRANDSVEIVNTVIMDDLAQFCEFSDAIMKIDIEGFEHKAFAHAEVLFERVRVSVVMMEWAAMVRFASQPETGPDRTLVMRMLNFFDSRRYDARDWSNGKLSVAEWTSWPRDIVWVLDTVQF